MTTEGKLARAAVKANRVAHEAGRFLGVAQDVMVFLRRGEEVPEALANALDESARLLVLHAAAFRQEAES